MINIAKDILKKNNDPDAMKIFPDFLWVVRDFIL